MALNPLSIPLQEFPLHLEQSSFHWKIGSTTQHPHSFILSACLSKFSRYCSALSANPISYMKQMELSLILARHLCAGRGGGGLEGMDDTSHGHFLKAADKDFGL